MGAELRQRGEGPQTRQPAGSRAPGSATDRSASIGQSLSGRILFVVYTIRRRDHEKETIRLISARQASRKERQAYTGLAN
ncbi:MAG: BrnT family toxin [Nitrospira sp.]|nr:BrnT family toxin [Nitrospira sp.]